MFPAPIEKSSHQKRILYYLSVSLVLLLWLIPLMIISLAAFKTAIVVKRLPKTRSGKVLRGTIRKIADKEDYKMPATIDDPAILTEITEELIKNNILKK